MSLQRRPHIQRTQSTTFWCSEKLLILTRRTLAELELQLELRGKALKEAKEKILNQLSKLQREEVALEEKIREQSTNVNI